MNRWVTLVMLGVLGALGTPHVADAGCGCAKPPPPRAVVRPFVAWPTETITLFNDNLVNGATYNVRFRSSVAHGVVWTKGTADNTHKDIADGQVRPRLTVAVPALPPGPCRITVWGQNVKAFSVDDDQFTVTTPPIALHQFGETIALDGYQAGVGRDGQVYLAFDLSQVTDATSFYGTAIGLPVAFGAADVTMYNDQGFQMQLLAATSPGQFSITPGDTVMSDVLGYWRHEFATYKQQHQQLHDFALDQDPNWHMDGTYHVNHDKIVVAINASTGSGHLARGVTPPFRLVVISSSSTAVTGLGSGTGTASTGGGGADDTNGDDGSDSELTNFLNSGSGGSGGNSGSGGNLLGR
jgi:hypothetical protein